MTATEEPRTAPDTATGEEIGLAEIVGFFRRQWLTIAACAALAVLVTVVYLGLFVQPLFTSTATLVVVSPTFAPEPEGGELSLQGYQRLLDSGAVRAQTGHQLQHWGQRGGVLALRDENAGFESERLSGLEDLRLLELVACLRQDRTAVEQTLIALQAQLAGLRLWGERR